MKVFFVYHNGKVIVEDKPLGMDMNEFYEISNTLEYIRTDQGQTYSRLDFYENKALEADWKLRNA